MSQDLKSESKKSMDIFEAKAVKDVPDKPDMEPLGTKLPNAIQFHTKRMIRLQKPEKPAKIDVELVEDEELIVRHYDDEHLIIAPEAADIVPVIKDSEEDQTRFYSKYKYLFGEDASKDKKRESAKLVGKFHILLLADSFELCNEGVAALNRCLAGQLKSTNAGTVTCSVFEPFDEIHKENIEAAERMDIKLISLAKACKEYSKPDDYPVNLYTDVVRHPEKYIEIFYSPEPTYKFDTYTHIIGHAPITHEYAVTLRNSLFRLSKLVMFFHVIPDDMNAFKSGLVDYESTLDIPTIERLIEIARMCHVVYSVSKKVFDYFTIIFRSKDVKDVNHRLYIPSAPKEVFDMTGNNHFYDKITFLTNGFLCNSSKTCAVRSGLDIAINSLTKLQQENITIANSNENVTLKLLISHLSTEAFEDSKGKLQRFGNTDLLQDQGKDSSDLGKLFHETNFFIGPKRCESYGFTALYSFCAGIPGLVPEDSITASIISEFEEGKEFIVPISKNPTMYKQNAIVWSKRLSNFIKNYESIKLKADALKMNLMRDERTRNTHDDFISFVLGGIKMKIRVVSLVPLDANEKDKTGLRLRFEELLVETMRACWRLKSHNLENCSNHEYVGSQITRGVVLPLGRLITEVFDKIEDYNRRVVAIDDTTKSLVIFCPTRIALRHLWAKCNVISKHFMSLLDEKTECNSLFNSFKIKSVETELIIEGDWVFLFTFQ
ncbi:hypothetical protein HELRODRAFT_161481 [Helobdella robusta]|uniref:Uncharacterized protein n=1 Tax=Helobdella robusta TaxID=6412 RepID=T1ERI9_HELRO|nr:hypothetical protein HELRODRAFT_161481 [Helobdella robusta]ESO02237.1 hypothetical protein HELRODRAFT_161481 [Helobdella robusta]